MKTVTIEVAEIFADLFKFEKRMALLRAGRDSGRSVVVSQMACSVPYMFPERDIIVCRDNYSDLINSTYSEIMKFITKYGLSSDFEFKKSPIYIRCKSAMTNIYFLGIGGADKSRTKSFEPEHKVSLIIFEELQQVADQENLEQAHASFRRLLDPEIGTMVHVYNPPSQNSNWVNIYWNMKKLDPDWLCIKSDYRDVAKYLTPFDIKEILKDKRHNEEHYKWFYLGETGGGFGSVYPQFKREKHYRPAMEVIERFGHTQGSALDDEAKRYRFGQNIRMIIIGVDGAVTHDSTSLTPALLMNNGQMTIAQIFHHDPKLSGQKASAELIPYIKRWLKELEDAYSIGQDVPIVFYCDSASTELIRMLRYSLSDRYDVYKYGKQTIPEMTGVMQSALSKNCIIIMDYGGYYDYVMNHFVKGESPLVVALENLVWNDKQTGYDPIVPNDDSDALTYAVNSIFRNPDNIYALDLFRGSSQDYYDNI